MGPPRQWALETNRFIFFSGMSKTYPTLGGQVCIPCRSLRMTVEITSHIRIRFIGILELTAFGGIAIISRLS